jgi:SAM-dependent methyltransferase
MLRNIFAVYSRKARARRAKILFGWVKIEPQWRLLDLGGGTGEHIHQILPGHRNVVIADLSADDLAVARTRFGYGTVQFDGSGRLPFADGEFDFVFCSSVIEHVTGPKDEVTAISDSIVFRNTAAKYQAAFAAEIRRIAKRYYVQTPHKYFVVESHSWLPGVIVLLGRPAQISLLAAVSRSNLWPKSTSPDWNLLVPGEMQALFPDSEIAIERSFGLPKSIMAIKSASDGK